MSNHVLEAPGIREWFEAATEVGNPDALLLALKLREKISADCPILDKLLPNPFNASRFFSVDHLSSLVNCLKVLHGSIHLFSRSIYIVIII